MESVLLLAAVLGAPPECSIRPPAVSLVMPPAKPKPVKSGYRKAYERAYREGKKLYIWIGYDVPSVRKQIDGVHYLAGRSGWLEEQYGTVILVSRPGRDGWMVQEKTVPFDRVRELLPVKQSFTNPHPTWHPRPRFAPMFGPPAMPPMNGGGFGGGGCPG